MRDKLIFAMAIVGLAAACGGRSNALRADQAQYETIEEGSASGVTTTLQGPGETLPPITGTNADTTTAFAFNPNGTPNIPAHPATIAGAPPPAEPYTGASTPAPARRTEPVPPREPEPQPASTEPAPPQNTEPATATTAAPAEQAEEPAEPARNEEPAEEPPPPPPASGRPR